LELGDFSITYQAAGFLEEVKFLISAESKLRGCMLDALHEAGIEIVSPTFMNQRQLSADQRFIPRQKRSARSTPESSAEARPEERMFDKAELAESEAKLTQELEKAVGELEALKRSDAGVEGAEASTARITELEARRDQLEAEIQRRQEEKDELNGEES
jgi:hypothetical protein